MSETAKKPCRSAEAGSGRLFFVRGLLHSESPMHSRRLSGLNLS